WLDHDAIEAQLLAKLREAIHELGGGAEGYPGAEELIVRELLEGIGLGRAPVGRARPRTPHGGPHELDVAAEELRDARARLLEGARLGHAGVDGNAEVHAGLGLVSRVRPRPPVRAERPLQL